MAITNILASGTTEATSADQTVAAGDVVTLSVIGGGHLYVQSKTSDGYTTQASLGQYADNGCQLIGPLTFRVFRAAQTHAVGCSMETA